MVYHRSSEQQKLAGSGRMLAVALSEKEVRQLLQQEGLEKKVEVACLNSPTSTVLAGPESVLQHLKTRIPGSTSSTLIPGNIAFHSSHVTPILGDMQHRLAFMRPSGNSDGKSKATKEGAVSAWSLPFISTVTGRVVTAVTPEYWCDNVRQPVLFQRAVETMFGGETAPDVVIEVGPHRTLLGPLTQVGPHSTGYMAV